jgi:hypothetical protein
MSTTTNGPAPTSRQLSYLRYLADETGTSFTYPKTKRQASDEIDRLRNLKAGSPRVPRLREPSIATDPNVYATAARADEITGYGSSAHWSTTNIKEPETLPKTPRVGPRVELARYTISAGERVIYGQRIQGSVRLTDAPANGQGRSYLIEEKLQVDGNESMNALIADYVEQAGQLDAIPVLSSVVRRDLQSEAG